MISDKNVVLVTHTDLDGVGCEVLFKHLGGNAVYRCDYDNVNEKVLDLLSVDGLNLIITDISVNPEVAKLIDEKYDGRVVLLDHHPKLDHLKGKDWAIIATKDMMLSGTSLFYHFLEGAGYDVKKYRDFAVIVKDYDLWIHNYPESKQLNQLFGLLGADEFVNRMLVNPSIGLTNTELMLMQVENDRKDRYIERAIKRVIIDEDKAYLFASQYISELGHAVLEKFTNTDIVFLIDPEASKVSLRSRDGVDCSHIAREHGGGGHPQACGFEIHKPYLYDVLDHILEL